MECCDIYRRHIVKADQMGVDGQETAQPRVLRVGIDEVGSNLQDVTRNAISVPRESCRRQTAHIGIEGAVAEAREATCTN